MKELTIEEAFEAMTLFLEIYYENTNSEDVGGLLSSMMILENGITADPAVWHDWIDSVEKAKQNIK